VKRQLVVLSTCSSGNGRVFHGQGTLSMGSSLLDAGALSVVHTLWPVDDRATSEILKGMYEGMLDGLTISAALHRSKLRFIETHADDGLAHPFYWSGVVLTGGEVTLPEGGLKESWFPLVLLPIGLLLFWAYRRSRSERMRSAS
jgi:CHAT domain-containing protein